MYGPSPVRKVSALIDKSGCIHVSGLLTEPSLLRAMMEIRAFSPYHSSGLYGLEPLQA
jgi:hypothetical protein